MYLGVDKYRLVWYPIPKFAENSGKTKQIWRKKMSRDISGREVSLVEITTVLYGQKINALNTLMKLTSGGLQTKTQRQ